MRDLTFMSGGVPCAAWHLTASSDALTADDGRPCVVMAHGFGCTRDSGLLDYAEGFAAAGLDVVLFDYRGFGDSGGTPRQRVAFRHQRTDYHAAIAAAREIDGVDPERIVLWGTSYSGGHVIPVAVADKRVAAVVAMTPAMDGLAALGAIARHGGLRRLRPLVAHGLRDAARALLRRAPHRIAIAGAPGSQALITADGAAAAVAGLAGPTWRNEVCARTALEVAFNRPIRFATRLRRPLLVQIGEHDTVAPPAAARRVVARAGRNSELRSYPVDHFDVYDGPWQQRVMADQIRFLSRSLGARPVPRRVAAGLADLGVRAGDGVATLLGDQPEHLELGLAATGMGAVIHALDPQLHADELSSIIDEAGARVLVVDETLLPLLDGLAGVQSIEQVVVVPRAEAVAPGAISYDALGRDAELVR